MYYAITQLTILAGGSSVERNFSWFIGGKMLGLVIYFVRGWGAEIRSNIEYIEI